MYSNNNKMSKISSASGGSKVTHRYEPYRREVTNSQSHESEVVVATTITLPKLSSRRFLLPEIICNWCQIDGEYIDCQAKLYDICYCHPYNPKLVVDEVKGQECSCCMVCKHVKTIILWQAPKRCEDDPVTVEWFQCSKKGSGHTHHGSTKLTGV